MDRIKYFIIIVISLLTINISGDQSGDQFDFTIIDGVVQEDNKKEAKAKAEKKAKEKAEKKAKEKAEKEAKIKAEKEAKIKAEKEAKEKAEKEAKIKAEKEAKAKSEKGNEMSFSDEDDAMDLSDVVLESSEIDDDDEKKEAAEIDKENKKNRKKLNKKGVKTSTIKKKYKPKSVKFYLNFFTINSSLNYKNMTTFNHLPYSNILNFHFDISFFGFQFKNIYLYIAKVGYTFTSNWDVKSIYINPITVQYQFNYYRGIIPLFMELSLYNQNIYHKMVPVSKTDGIDYFTEYFSFKFGYRFKKYQDIRSRVYLEVGFGPDDIESATKEYGFFIGLGVSGNFSPINISITK